MALTDQPFLLAGVWLNIKNGAITRTYTGLPACGLTQYFTFAKSTVLHKKGGLSPSS